jgi:hypothetical protein
VSSVAQNLAATIFEHPWFLVLIAVVTLVRWLASKAKSTPQDTEPLERPPSNPIPRGGETQSEEERIRRFLEALGQRPGSSPPPAAPRRRQVTPKTSAPPFSTLPPLKTTPPPLPSELTTTPSVPPPLPIEPASSRRARVLEPTFEVRDTALQTPNEPPPEVPRAARFAGRIKFGTPQDLRAAIVLREIFGPPRALQPFDLTSL